MLEQGLLQNRTRVEDAPCSRAAAAGQEQDAGLIFLIQMASSVVQITTEARPPLQTTATLSSLRF